MCRAPRDAIAIRSLPLLVTRPRCCVRQNRRGDVDPTADGSPTPCGRRRWAQTIAHTTGHLIEIDSCRETELALATSNARPAKLSIMWMPRDPLEMFGLGRASQLRDIALRCSIAPCIAFLDDDNEWLWEHLETPLSTRLLMAAALPIGRLHAME